MLHRSSRPAVAGVVVGLLASVGGLGASVAAFGQTSSDPTSGYTVSTVPLGEYTTTVPSAPPVPAIPRESTVTAQSPTRTSGGSSTPSVTVPRSETTAHGTPSIPPRTTRNGPRHLAFTGAEPLLVAGAGIVLMLAGFGLHRHRRSARSAA
jgi:hypothetical protein